MNKIELYPNAKINLGLNVLYKREDGYHELDSVMLPIGLHDVLTIEQNPQKEPGDIEFSSSGIIIDGSPDNNLVVKAYRLLATEYNLPAIKVHLKKQIPFGAGLGGGSADAAFMLKGLNELFGLKIPEEQLENYAAKLGSDCAFFIKNKPALAKGRGEILTPFSIDLSNYQLLLIVPNIHVSTAQAYSRVVPALPEKTISEILQLPAFQWKETLKNDFEPSVFHHEPGISLVKEKIYSMGAIYASMSGSGSSVFGIFPKGIKLKPCFPEEYFVGAWDF